MKAIITSDEIYFLPETAAELNELFDEAEKSLKVSETSADKDTMNTAASNSYSANMSDHYMTLAQRARRQTEYALDTSTPADWRKELVYKARINRRAAIKNEAKTGNGGEVFAWCLAEIEKNLEAR
jgi:hypothetical protein